MKKKNVLILGSGGREHALAWKISQSDHLDELYIAPGNPGTSNLGTNVNLSISDFPAIIEFCITNSIGLVVVGPEAPLVNGIHDALAEYPGTSHIIVIGPKKAGALLEGSKDFSKEFMHRHHIPTAAYRTFDSSNIEEGEKFLETLHAPYVLKCDGLAAGKGVLILDALEEAKASLRDILADGSFGDAGSRVVIEEFLSGTELSVFILTDGKDYLMLPTAKDYKRIGEGDTGLNTGGMGALSPSPVADEAFMDKVRTKIIDRTISGLQKDGIEYQGFLFIGLMRVGGEPYVIEYNVRMGDPETEAVLPRIESDLLAHFKAVSDGSLGEEEMEISSTQSTTIMMVSGGYPEAYEKGKEIKGLENVNQRSIVFQAGTRVSEGRLLTSGGRVLTVTSMAESLNEALENSYENIKKIEFDKCNYRKDIGYELTVRS